MRQRQIKLANCAEKNTCSRQNVSSAFMAILQMQFTLQLQVGIALLRIPYTTVELAYINSLVRTQSHMMQN